MRAKFQFEVVNCLNKSSVSQIAKFEGKELILKTIKMSQLQRAYHDACEWLPTLPWGHQRRKYWHLTLFWTTGEGAEVSLL